MQRGTAVNSPAPPPPSPPKQKLSFRQRLCYSVGHFQNDAVASLWFTYFLVFYEKVLEWPTNYAGYLMLIGQVADAVSTPVVGFLADKKYSSKNLLCRYGRRKTWHLIGTVCVLVTCPFIFTKCLGCSDAGQGTQLAYYSVFVIIFQFGWACVQVSHLSLVADLTPFANERTTLLAKRYTSTVMANILVFCSAWVFLRSASGSSDDDIGPDDASSFQYAMIVGLGTGAVFSFIFHVGLTEPNPDAESSKAKCPSEEGGVGLTSAPSRKTSVREYLGMIKLYQVAGVYMCSRLFANLTQVYTPLYLEEENMGAQSIAVIPLVMYISGFAFSLIVKILNKYLGRQGAYAIGCVVGLSGCVWVYFGCGDAYATYEIYAVAILIGAGSTLLVVTGLGLTADLIGTQTDSGAFVYGAMSFTDKLSNGLAVVFLEDFYSSHSRQVLAYVCGGSSVLGLAFLVTLRLKCSKTSSAGSSVEKGIQTEEETKESISK